VLTFALLLPYIANTTGWLLTELGRQPWIVFGLMTVDQAVSPNVAFGSVLTSLIGFTLIFAGLMAADIFLLNKYAKAGIAGPEDVPTDDEISLLSGAHAK
jgi:cytochrome d ubiquinol oxidase subunit I